MWARRYLIETTTSQKTSATSDRATSYAVQNPRAIVRTPLSYERIPRVAEDHRPLPTPRLHDRGRRRLRGARDRVRSGRRPPHAAIGILAGRYAAAAAPASIQADASALAGSHPELHRRRWPTSSGRSRESARDEVDMAQLYDCFSSSVVFALEGLGLAERGGAIELDAIGSDQPRREPCRSTPTAACSARGICTA